MVRRSKSNLVIIINRLLNFRYTTQPASRAVRLYVQSVILDCSTSSSSDGHDKFCKFSAYQTLSSVTNALCTSSIIRDTNIELPLIYNELCFIMNMSIRQLWFRLSARLLSQSLSSGGLPEQIGKQNPRIAGFVFNIFLNLKCKGSVLVCSMLFGLSTVKNKSSMSAMQQYDAKSSLALECASYCTFALFNKSRKIQESNYKMNKENK